jgi:hypothetical protein
MNKIIILRAIRQSSTLRLRPEGLTEESRSFIRKILTTAFLLILFSLYVESVYALKILPQSKSNSKTAVVKKSQATGISIVPKFRRDRKALLVYFSNLQNTESVSYMLIYKTNGQQEGAGGSVKPSEGNANRELLFGTCSKNVCRYHTNLSNMSLEVTAKLKSGKTLLKRYKIRI